ncbi:class I SAM-dependent methyltransferase [Haloarchaeobius sp. HRN-SO-5]|uniref:class I SAM-dependent methyltransferase n=1 Tax=Haloarchaeobius sp. HRN-SO-5 TaxID=3446118 RepID=UPI003EC02B1A
MSGREHGSDGWQLADSGPEAYERYLVPALFAPWADLLVEYADLHPGERVLDVGCGTGIVARRAASQVRDDGVVVGLDINEAMLDVARETSSEVRPAIEWRLGDATDVPFGDESFDVVFCQQALQFVPDPAAALREMHRVLSPGGRLVVGVLRSLEFNHPYVVLADALATHVSEEAAETMRSPFPDWGATAIRALIEDADFRAVTILIDIRSLRYPSAEEFLRREAASSPLAGHLAEATSSVRSAIIEDLETELEEYTDDRGIVFPIETYVAIARREPRETAPR